MSYSHWVIDALFVGTVALIWFMLGYQSVLFFLGHIYYRRTRKAAQDVSELPDSELPGISVLVPCHNEARVIAHTIRALQGLEYPADKIEFLLINDGSTDNTAEVIRSFSADRRVRLLEVPPDLSARGKASALNYALPYTRHSVLAVYDADNLPEPGALRSLAVHLVRHPELAAAVGMYRAWNRRRALLTRLVNIEGIGFQWIVQAGRWMLMRLTMLPGTNYVVHRAVIERVGGWDERALTEDSELTVRLYEAGYYVQLVPTSVSWEQEPESLLNWFRQRRRWVRGFNYVMQKHAFKLLRARPRRIAFEILSSHLLYYFFFLAVVASDILFVLCLARLININVPGPYSLVWILAYATFVLQLVIALSCERGEDSVANILLTVVMYFTYCQLWIPVVAVAFYDDFIVHREMKWAKTERVQVGTA
ncbi:MAG: glycosyltransferase family 2 protein [Terriglobia bacterium]|jgi:cellulose synthase/poly-beta-1,6-N-acetylglucosamine synthase-like glycosyltransferase